MPSAPFSWATCLTWRLEASSALQRLDEHISGSIAQVVNLVYLRKHAGVFLCLLLAALVVLSFVTIELPGKTLLSGAIQDTGHTLAFFALTFACLMFLQKRITGIRALFLLACLLIGIGLLIEAMQAMSGRGFSRGDLLRNCLGIVAAYASFMAIRRRAAIQGTTRIFMVLVATGMIGLGVNKVARLLISKHFGPSVPQLISFDQWYADLWIETRRAHASVAVHIDSWPSNSTKSVRVRFDSGRWSMVRLLEPPADWTGYDTLSFTVFNPSSSSREVMVRIDEWDNELSLRRGTTIRQHLASGQSVITLDFAQIRHRISAEYNYKSPPLTKVRAITLIIRRNEQPIELFFDNFYLK